MPQSTDFKLNITIFVRFLMAHQISIQTFVSEAQNTRRFFYLSDFRRTLTNNPESIIDASIIWAYTSQGASFWDNLDREWRKYYLSQIQGYEQKNSTIHKVSKG